MSTSEKRPKVFPKAADSGGMALLITLAMLVLIFCAIFAFFIRATSDRKVQGLTTMRAETTVLGRGIQNAIVWELRNEMLAGSDATGPDTNSPAKFVVLRPRTAADMIPKRVLTPAVATSDGTAPAGKFDNLVKQSISEEFAFPGSSVPAPILKAAAASSAGLSLDGRAVSARAWNLPRLIGDSTSASGFDHSDQLPQWILVTRNGITGTPTLAQAKDRSSTNDQYVIGRFAYNIYDEGGLIDINVAGFPSAAGTGANLQLLKGTPAGSDLTRIPGIPSAQVVDQLIDWRNAASVDGYSPAEPNGLHPYVNAMLQFGAVKGYLKPWSDETQSEDRQFLNRQDLIRFVESGQAGFQLDAGGVPLALPYLTTFSRGMDQPSYAPDPNRPRAVSNTAADNYAGNDSSGHDDDMNPAFLSVRVTSDFPRNDGSMAAAGEPLVKKRFALNRLAWLTYQGPSANRSASDPDIKTLLENGIPASFIKEGTGENIQKYFGLTWDPAKHYWTYSHSITGSTGKPIIGYLSKIRDANREPDFFELLKSAINTGSIAKGATAPGGMLEESSQYVYDTKLDHALLQAGANIIDQFDADGYPIRIRFNDGNTVTEYRGIENLPYFYRIRDNTVISALPQPPPSKDFKQTETDVDPWNSSSDLTDCGFYAVFWQPEVWNPHDINSSLGNPRPSHLRIVADGSPLDADGNSLTGTYNTNQNITQCWIGPRYYSYNLDATRTPASYNTSNPSATVTWKGDNTALTFTDNNGALFREPTLLTKPNVPAGSNLAIGPDNLMNTLYQDPQLLAYWDSTSLGVKCLNDPDNLNSPVPYLGFYYGQGPLRWVQKNNSDQNWVMTANRNQSQTTTTAGSSAVTYRVQYSDDASSWTTYEQKYVTNIREQGQVMFVNKDGLVSANNAAIGKYQWVGSTDPRTSRFGNPGGAGRGQYYAVPWLNSWADKENNMVTSDRPDTSSGFGWGARFNSNATKRDTVGLAEAGGWYPNPATNWMLWASTPPMFYRPGLLSQNNTLATSYKFPPQSLVVDASPGPQYYADPDGVVRRAMAAFVPTNGNTSPATTTVGLPMAATISAGVPVANQSQSRPIILNRPFRSVGELGYVFSGTPWKNLDLFTPESGYLALLDVFGIQETDRADALVAGKINLNTRRKPVLEAVLAGAYKDALAAGASITTDEAGALATLLAMRTQSTSATDGPGPLQNIGDLVGRWYQNTGAPQGGIDGSRSYDGFSADVDKVWGASGSNPNPTWNNIERFREAPIRALADIGTARTWNLLIDLVVQTGHFPARAATFDDFLVRGEQHYWLHVAIDRITGQVIDKQLEIVRE